MIYRSGCSKLGNWRYSCVKGVNPYFLEQKGLTLVSHFKPLFTKILNMRRDEIINSKPFYVQYIYVYMYVFIFISNSCLNAIFFMLLRDIL